MDPDYTVRQPRLTVLANGVAVPSPIVAEVHSSAYLGADRFSVRLAFSLSDTAFWLTLPLLIEIQVMLDGAQGSLITGHADSVELDPIRGEVVLHGRDLTALLISAQTGETFENQTAGGIAELLGARHGLTANVAQTSGLVGRYYQTGHTRTTLNQHARATSEWDVLTWLADQEGFDVWVSGTTLNFQPRAPVASGAMVTPTLCSSLAMRQALDLAAGINIVVKSWNSQNQQMITQSASRGSSATTLTAVRPNLSTQDAMTLAQQTLAQISAHEIEITYEMPGDLVTMPRTTVGLAQTGSVFDGTYEIVEVERRISFDTGFSQRVVARSLPWTPS